MNPVILKSPNDKNLYKAIVLQNGLKALLISDVNETAVAADEDDEQNLNAPEEDSGQESAGEEAQDEHVSDDEDSVHDRPDDDGGKGKMAAAALCVGVGSFSDPFELQGLAHFLEHMIFMGSTKYPVENAFDSFISKHGGSTNASTDRERTVFQMDLTPEYLKEALDILANCFISPLLKPDSMNREIEAVDSEFVLAAPVDSERLAMLLASIAKPNHPFSKFSYGNTKSLKEMPLEQNIDVNAELHRFYKRYYSSGQMTLAVQSTETLEKLEEWVRETFSLIPNNGLEPDSFDALQGPFEMEQFHKLYKVVPVKKTHQVTVTWTLPPVESHYKTKPLHYLGWLVGHEGRGSILSYLKKRSWAVYLGAGNDESGCDMNSTGSFFSVNVYLTESGMDNVFQVLTAVFQYLKMLQAEGPKEYIFNELQAVRQRAFQFQEQKDPVEYVEHLAENMQLYPPEHYIAGNYLYFEYDENIVADYLKKLTFNSANICILSSRFSEESDDWKTEPWTQCKYKCEDIPARWLKIWEALEVSPELHLPESNKFIATDFDLKHSGDPQNELPIKLLEDEQCRLWYKEDVKFKVPKAYAYFHIMNPLWHCTPLNSAMTELFCSLFHQVMTEDTYPAEVAELSYIEFCSSEGIGFKFYGFNHKLPVLLETVLDGIVNFDVDDQKFESVKAHKLEYYYNRVLKPHKLCKDLGKSILCSTNWSIVEKKYAIESVTWPMLKNFMKQCLSHVFMESIIQGNITDKEALLMNRMFISKLKCKPLDSGSIPELRIRELREETAYCRVASFSTEDHNSVIANYYQLGPGCIKTSCKLALLLAFMYEPCFDVLRTCEKLGYDVGCIKENIRGVLGFYITVRSPSNKFSCSYVDERIEEFLQSFLNETRKIGVEGFFTQLESLIKCKKCEDLCLRDEVDRHWTELITHYYVFDRKQKEISCLEQLDMHDFMDWLDTTLLNNADKRRKLSLQVVGPGEARPVQIPQFSNPGNSGNPGNTGENGPNLAGDRKHCEKVLQLQYICSNVQDVERNFITSIDEFIRSLPMAPVHKIT